MHKLKLLHDSMLTEAARRNNLNFIPETDTADGYYESADDSTFMFNHNLGDFNINNVAARELANDKITSSHVLNSNGIIAVPHYPLTRTSYRNLKIQTGCTSLVAKERRGMQGSGFTILNNIKSLATLKEEAYVEGAWCLSPYYDYPTEYRVSVVNGEVKFIYAKERCPNNLQHNLSVGASVNEVPLTIISELSRIAIAATEAIGLTIANVDLFLHKQQFIIMEVNGTVTLKRVALLREDWVDKITDVYTDILALAVLSREEQLKQLYSVNLS